MAHKDFANRLARIETRKPELRSQNPRASPPKKRWPLWFGLFGVLVVAAVFLMDSGEPRPKFDEVFSGTSEPAFAGELMSVSYPHHGFQIDIPSDWREMTRDEVEAAGGRAETGEAIEIVDLTSGPIDVSNDFRFVISTQRTQEKDAVALVAFYQQFFTEGLMAHVLRFIGFDSHFLTAPTPVALDGLSVAETTAIHSKSKTNALSLYRVYVLDSDMVEITVYWGDPSIHPAAFAPVLNSLREL